MNFCLKLILKKWLEIEAYRQTEWSWIDIMLRWTRKEDHAGILINVELIGFNLTFNIYDERHWNYEKNRWEQQVPHKR